MRQETVEIEPGYDRPARDHRDQGTNAEFNRLFDQNLKPRPLDRGEHKSQVDADALLSDLTDRLDPHARFGERDDTAHPFAVATVEDEDLVAEAASHHRAQVVGLVVVERDRICRDEVAGNPKPKRGAMIAVVILIHDV